MRWVRSAAAFSGTLCPSDQCEPCHIQLQDALTVGEEHFYLFALAGSHETRIGEGNSAGKIARAFVDLPVDFAGGHVGPASIAQGATLAVLLPRAIAVRPVLNDVVARCAEVAVGPPQPVAAPAGSRSIRWLALYAAANYFVNRGVGSAMRGYSPTMIKVSMKVKGIQEE